MKDVKAQEHKDKIPIFNARSGKVEEVKKINKTDAEWKKILTSEQFEVTRLKGTEAPFTGKCEVGEGGGVYECVCCGTDLFAVGTKFESGTGWPSFWEPVSSLNIRTQLDRNGATEVLCARCDAHLGHVFEDGPPPTHKRYCINAVALKFLPLEGRPKTLKTATFAGGCFWGVQDLFSKVKGVEYTSAGYTGGRFKNPTYEEVSSGKTGHAEAVEVMYDPDEVSYKKLLDIFWASHDPTSLNRQGLDKGTQYRSAIFYRDEEQKREALASKESLGKSGKFKRKIVTEIAPAGTFYPAEEYHQYYYRKTGIKACPR